MGPDLNLLARGAAAGGLALGALSVLRGGARADPRRAMALAWASAAAWVLVEAGPDAASPRPLLLQLAAFPAAGLFWAFVLTLFEDRRLRPALLAPAALLLAVGAGMTLAPPALQPAIGIAFNVAAALLSAHAALVVARGWRGDLVDARRMARAVVLGLASVFALAEGLTGVMAELQPGGPWAGFGVGQALGGLLVLALALSAGVLFLQPQPDLFGPAGSTAEAESGDARLVAARRVLDERLTAAMDGGAWRDEALSIGGLARAVGAPEHQLRDLINRGHGYRNFADYVNAYRLAAAQARLADPAEARSTVAAIAFDVGFGSLSAFNRAFRAATGETPTAWRNRRLAEANSTAAAG